MTDQLPSAERNGRSLLLLLTVALVLRIGIVIVLQVNLTDDRDIYLELARGLRDSRGYSTPGTEQPTAFRPPLYPIVLSAVTGISEPVGVAVLNVVLGIGTTLLTYWLGLRFGLSKRAALLAGAIVAVDPLLLLYTTLPMTETLCAFLAAAMLLAVSPGSILPLSSGKEPACDGQPVRRAATVGLLFGLCVLSRPTFWVFGGLMAIRFLMQLRWRSSEDAAGSLKPAGATLAAVALVAAAWPIRNLLVLDAPVLTTTHGGYTLLMGNNPAFYDEVVRQPLGTVWDGSNGPGQQVWVQGVHDEMRRQDVAGEVAQDRWMTARAWENIRAEPGTFVRACALRLIRFWNIVPSGGAADTLPRELLWVIGGAYGLLFVAAGWGVVAVLRERRRNWVPVLLLIVSFTLVHLIYWSNARMRAPVMPAVAVLAAAGLGRLWPIRHGTGCSES